MSLWDSITPPDLPPKTGQQAETIPLSLSDKVSFPRDKTYRFEPYSVDSF
jgi:hypothetical protein